MPLNKETKPNLLSFRVLDRYYLDFCHTNCSSSLDYRASGMENQTFSKTKDNTNQIYL